MKTLCTLLGVTALAFLWLVIFGSPAYADDCATLVTKFSDLADPSKIQDCLRTGSNWGRVLGTVTAVTGGLIGAGGLPRGQKGGPEDYGKEPRHDNPCQQASALGHRIKAILDEKDRMEAQILREWKSYAKLAEGLAMQYRMIKENEILARFGWSMLKTKQGAKLTLAIYSLVTGLRAIRAATAAAAAATAAGLPAASAAAPTLWTTTPQLSFLLSEIKDFADPGKLQDYKEFFTGTPDVQDLWNQLMKAAAAYQKQAHAFNDAFDAWGRSRQAALDAMYQKMNNDLSSATEKLKDAYIQCRLSWALQSELSAVQEDLGNQADSLDFPDHTIAPFQIPILHAWTDLGRGWTIFEYGYGQVTE